jgi:hypothetical protein
MRVEVDGAIVDAFPRLPPWVSALCTLPLLLVFIGGLVGGIVATLATYGNFRIARSRLPVIVRIVAGALVTGGAYVVTLGIGTWIRSMTG